MPSKKTSKVIDNEIPKVVDNQEPTVLKKLSKAKSKKNDPDLTNTVTESEKLTIVSTKSKKNEPDLKNIVTEPGKSTIVSAKSKKNEPDQTTIINEPEKPTIDLAESEPIKTPKSKKKVKDTKVENLDAKSVIEQVKPETKPKKKVKESDSNITDKPIIETKSEKISSELDVVTKTIDTDKIIQDEVDEIKTYWLSIVNKINDNDAEGKRLEIEKNKIVKKLKELLDKLQTDNSEIKGFLIDNKIQLSNTKNDIIPIKSDSISESESCDESSDSDSEDIKPLLINKSSKTKTLIKTTKGSSKVPKLAINDSDSDSD